VRRRCLTLITFALVACRGESEVEQTPADTVAPIGTGTERLLTEERLALLHEWIAAMARARSMPMSIEEIEPPAADAPRHVPLERYRRDGWGRSIHYEYRREDRSYELRSPGEDGQLGTSDDVTSSSVVRPP
jgi:hypothetical protein